MGLRYISGMPERQLTVFPQGSLWLVISIVSSPFCGGSFLPFERKYLTAQPTGALKLKHWQFQS